jgi:hypothetical protein
MISLLVIIPMNTFLSSITGTKFCICACPNSSSIFVSIHTGFLDGINDSLVEKNPLDDLEEDTEVNLGFDKALLYKNMVAAEADWLYNLEEWNAIFDEETRKELYKEQKSSTTIVKEQKVYPNDPCPCGSGKKYKKCCGRK